MTATLEPTQNAAPLNMDEVRVDPAWALRIPPSLAVRRAVLPFASLDGHVYVACLDANDANTMQTVQRAVEMPIRPTLAEPESLRRALQRIFGDGKSAVAANPIRGRVDAGRRSKPTRKTPPDCATSCCMPRSCGKRRTCISIRTRNMCRCGFRVDGILEPYRRLPPTVQNALISRFKVLSSMDIAEKRAPQDGRFTHRFGPTGQAIDVRVATLPTKYGERMTLRLLALQTTALTLERLGMSPHDLGCFEELINKPHGMILLTGPTGSGKSTTLYAALRRLIAQEQWNIVTIEDPIEYAIAGVAQVEVDSADKVSFGKALRSVLRHDPDIVMIGEIRDRETADVAIKASLTGHLVLSTLHTNSAASVITRLTDMGVDRYLTAATVRLAVAQRLVRRLCQHCRKERALTRPRRLRSDARRRRVAPCTSPRLFVLCQPRLRRPAWAVRVVAGQRDVGPQRGRGPTRPS